MKLRTPISIRFLLVLVMVLSAQTLATIWIASDRINASIVQEKETEIRVILDSFRQTYDVLSHNNIFFDAEKILFLLNEDPSIEKALIFDSKHRVASSLNSELIGKSFEDIIDEQKYPLVGQYLRQSEINKEDVIWHDKGQKFVHAISPVGAQHVGDKSIVSGSIYVRLNMLDMEQLAFSRLIKALVPIITIVVLTALFTTWYFHRYVNRRINDLRSSANTFTDEGRISLPALTVNDELSDLQQSISRLMEQVEKKAEVERKMQESQQKSHELEQQLSLHWQKTPMGVIEWDIDFRVAAWNPAAEKIFGYSAGEAKGQHASLIVPDEAKPQVNFIWQELLSHKKAMDSTNLNLTKDGRFITCDWVNTPLITDDNEVIGVASFVWDNTSEHEAVKSLVKREQEQSEILNSMTDGVISIDGEGIIKSFNRAAEKLFGYRAHEMLDKNIDILMPPEIAKHHNEYLAAYSEESTSQVVGMGREVLSKHKNGELIPIHLSVSELPKSVGGKRRFIGNCNDLRQKKQQEEILRRTQKMESLGKLTGGIAHDFNNILGVVTGYTDLLLAKLRNEPALAKYAQEIKTASIRGTKLTSKLLASSKKKRYTNEKVDINQVLHDQQKMLKQTLNPNIKLIYQTQDDLWPTELDSDDLEDVILNICLNSMHAMENGGKLCLFTYNTTLDESSASKLNVPPGEYVSLCITDTGTGMDEATRERIFEPFFTTKGENGTGLGLSQVFGFVERSNAAISVDSSLGEGSQFSLYFPRLKEAPTIESQPINSQQTEETVTEKGKENILVVDDEIALSNLCVEVLSGHGYLVQSASSGEEALKLLEKNHFDLLLSDIVMPGMDGYELANKAKKLKPGLKVQLTSGYDPAQHQEYGDKSLRKTIIPKPYTPFILLKQVRNALDQTS